MKALNFKQILLFLPLASGLSALPVTNVSAISGSYVYTNGGVVSQSVASSFWTIPPVDASFEVPPQTQGGETSSARSSIKLDLTPRPTIFVTSAGESSGNALHASSFALATLTYAFEILGPIGSVPIQIEGIGTTFVDVTGNVRYSTSASLNISGTGLSESWNSTIGNIGNTVNTPDVVGNIGGFAVSGEYIFRTNTIYSIVLSATASHSTDGVGSADISAYVDPTFKINLPSSQAGLYSLAFSPGIGNIRTSVPDNVSTIPLLATALGVIAFVSGRQRKRALAGRSEGRS